MKTDAHLSPVCMLLECVLVFNFEKSKLYKTALLISP